MKQKQTIGYKEVTFRGIEGNYIICDIRVHPASIQLVKDNKGNTIKQRFTGLLVGKKVKFDESNLKLLEKLKKLRKRTKITVIYNKAISLEDLRDVTIIDITNKAELEEKISYLFDVDEMILSATEKAKYKSSIQKGKDIIKKNHIKGVDNTAIKYNAQQELSVNEFIELLKQEEAKGRKTYVVVKTKAQ